MSLPRSAGRQERAPPAAAAALPASAPILSLSGMTKRFGAVLALDDVTIDVGAGEIHCLLGENGAGKSTLCNLIFGLYPADAGEMRLAGAPYRPAGPADALAGGIAMVHQHFSLIPDFTVVDNLLLGRERGFLHRGAYAEKLEALAASFGLPLDPFAVVGDLSVGERQRVEIVKCLVREPRLLVLDEPTAVLPPDEVEAFLAVCRRVAAGGCGVVLVTHKLAEVKRAADRVTVLRHGRSVASSASPAEDIDRLVRAMIQRDLASLDTALASTLGVAKESAAPAEARPRRDRRADALQIDGLTVRDAVGTLRLDELTLTVAKGEIVGLAGVEGNGQSELGAVLAGLLRPSGGRLFVDGREMTNRPPAEITALGVGIIPEDRHAVGCIAELSLAENFFLNRIGRFARRGLIDRDALRRQAQELMQRFDIRAAGPAAPFSSLSGGNQQKAVLARELTIDNLVFLLAAQPTRGLDVGAVEAIYKHIRAACDAGAGVLLISSELDELIAVADRVIVLYRGRIMGERLAGPDQREAIGAMMSGHAP
ncbi:MAG: ABC transporter ATP-binding protein [Stellaceae bacterium]